MLKLRGSQQVILQVRAAEIDRDIWKKLSVQQGVNTSFSDHGRVILTTIPSLSTLSAFATGALSTNISGQSASNFEILEQEGLVKTLAEPTLTCDFRQRPRTSSPAARRRFRREPTRTATRPSNLREFGVRLEFTPDGHRRGPDQPAQAPPKSGRFRARPPSRSPTVRYPISLRSAPKPPSNCKAAAAS